MKNIHYVSTGRNVFYFHTRTKTGRSKRLQIVGSEPFVQVFSEDAKALQLTDGEMVAVKSRRGEAKQESSRRPLRGS